jgi:hypothetical protein
LGKIAKFCEGKPPYIGGISKQKKSLIRVTRILSVLQAREKSGKFKGE